ncbi:hypothetical protein [Burkholderia cepacia]|uniref:hypothetical protein n=1 Tax=Burkholderia cepacia TaxID=292 RepID=UPI0009BE3EDD
MWRTAEREAFPSRFSPIRRHFDLNRHLRRASLYRKQLATWFELWHRIIGLVQNPPDAFRAILLFSPVHLVVNVPKTFRPPASRKGWRHCLIPASVPTRPVVWIGLQRTAGSVAVTAPLTGIIPGLDVPTAHISAIPPSVLPVTTLLFHLGESSIQTAPVLRGRTRTGQPELRS